VFSWDEPSRDARVVTMPGVHRAVSEPEPPAPPPSPPRVPSPTPMLRPAVPMPPAASDDALLAALLEGLGAPGLRIDALTPELMQLVGQLLRESTRGAVELLVARAALKREMRAEMTMIVARENNPLKFSPSVEVALQHLLGTPSPGFMAPAPAMRDAFDDLRAHQLGVMAGMKAALEGVLQRFDPQQLEGKLTRKSAINSLIPATRKARLWELFQELFGQISSEAQDDFDELFGRAFLRAYEAQLDRLHGEPGAR
jgi:type VI secretion system FHA domain protein